jgi:8-oxo-dGTP diphosphatase
MDAKGGIMIHKILNMDIRKAIEKHSRLYLAGNLKRGQELKHIQTDRIEIGITKMSAGETEAPHLHEYQWEFVFVLSGQFRCIETATGEKYDLTKGDFFVIENRTKYAQEALTDCILYFVKHPAIEDKVVTFHETI